MKKPWVFMLGFSMVNPNLSEIARPGFLKQVPAFVSTLQKKQCFRV